MVEFTLYSVTADLHIFVNLAAEFSLSGMINACMCHLSTTVDTAFNSCK